MAFFDKIWECLGYKSKKDNTDYNNLIDEDDILGNDTVSGFSMQHPPIESYPRAPISLSSSQVHAIMYDQ